MAALSRLAWLAALVLLLVPACGGRRASWSPSTGGRYGTLSEDDAVRFRGACSGLERGEVEQARRELADLAERHPDHVAVGVWLQEAEIRAAALALPTGSAEGETPAAPLEDDVLAELRARYLAEAEARPTAARLVLAARLEPDVSRAADLLDRALTLDPSCAWAHYGKAFLAMRSKSWHSAREAIGRALDADPGHMRTRRLQAAMLARGGALDDAIRLYEAWIEYAGTDPTIQRRLVSEAQLDLAILLVLSGDAGRARRVLDGMHGTAREDERRYATLAACEEALEEWSEALAAAQRAAELAPDDPLPIVQQALLYEYWLEDADAAGEAWRRVLSAAGDEGSLAALLQRTRARVRVERAELASEPETDGP